MYAGVFTLNKGDFFYCEEQPCTAPLPGWFIFVFLVKLKFIYWLSSDWFHEGISLILIGGRVPKFQRHTILAVHDGSFRSQISQREMQLY